MTEVILTNTMTGQQFFYSVEVVNLTQFYDRLGRIMSQLAVIEGVNPNNIQSTINHAAIAA